MCDLFSVVLEVLIVYRMRSCCGFVFLFVFLRVEAFLSCLVLIVNQRQHKGLVGQPGFFGVWIESATQ